MFRSNLLLMVISTFCLIVVINGLSPAEIPQFVNYQARITDSGGTPVSDGSYSMQFRIYDAETGGTLLWNSGTSSYSLNDGVVNVLLGESPHPALGLDFDDDYWLLVTFQGTDQLPRKRLTSAGYSFTASGLVPGTAIQASISSWPNAVIFGENTSTAASTYGGRFETGSSNGSGIYGGASSTTGSTYGVRGDNNSTSGGGVYGFAGSSSGSTSGVYGESNSINGTGVTGSAVQTTGETWGVYGGNSSTQGGGVRGINWATTGFASGVSGQTDSNGGYGVRGTASATTGTTYGVWGESASTSGRGVCGRATATAGSTYAGLFENSSTGGTGVYGTVTATSGITLGVHGISSSTEGRGVCGWATSTTGTNFGGLFSSTSETGIGVAGWATEATGINFGVRGVSYSSSGTGLYGYALASTGVNFGVYGISNSPSGWAGYFAGNAKVTGNLTVDGTLSGSGIGDITAVIAGTGLDGGATSGAATLNVEVPFNLYGSSALAVIRGENNVAGSYGVEGENQATTGNGAGVFGASYSTNGSGVLGRSEAGTGPCSGVEGYSASTVGSGVFGSAYGSTGQNYGVRGITYSSSGHGVYGRGGASSGPSYGVYGTSVSPEGYAVYGYADSYTGFNYGGYFRSLSAAGTGVYGIAAPTTGEDRIGVHGVCTPADFYGVGVKGEGYYEGVLGLCNTSGSSAGSYYGARAEATISGASGTAYGVYGHASGAGTRYGVYYSGGLGGSSAMKNIVKTDEGPVALYGHLTTENWFEDFGSGTIRDGRSVIRLADDYLKTVSISNNSPIKVFITPKADIGRWWVEDDLNEFTLFAPDAPNGAEFDFRVVAKRPGHEGMRLERAPSAYTDRHLYTDVAEVPARYQAEWLKAAEVNQSSPRNSDSDR